MTSACAWSWRPYGRREAWMRRGTRWPLVCLTTTRLPSRPSRSRTPAPRPPCSGAWSARSVRSARLSRRRNPSRETKSKQNKLFSISIPGARR
ncbi:hypothetical protein FOCC_FOCC002749 [Frankliniella occidentalis]|nr:hypothetical protein FOCC_FOCC002749 [Frankliniella occidentalis]